MARATVKKARPASGLSRLELDGLRRWNLGMAAIYFVQCIAVLLFSKSQTVAVQVMYLAKDAVNTNAANGQNLVPAMQHVFDIKLAYVVAAALLAATIIHALAGRWPLERYEHDIAARTNRFRWLVVALGGGLMLLAVALVIGIRDIASLFLLAGTMVVAAAAGSKAEATAALRSCGRLCGAAAISSWAVVLFYLIMSVIYGRDVPGYAWVLLSVLSAGIVSAALLARVGRRQTGRWHNYATVERSWTVLLFATNSLLAWVTFAGSLRP